MLNGIIHKVLENNFESMTALVISRTAYRLTIKVHEDYPNEVKNLTKGHPFDMATNIFDKLPQVFYAEEPFDNHIYVQILGREGNNRVFKYIRAEYVNEPKNLYKYKIYLPSANGNGKFGEILSNPVLSAPGIGATETFISVGCCETEEEATYILKYIKTKFMRAMLGILKTTHHLTPSVWKYVPLQDFTAQSDIDWSQSIHDIDLQLYKKYGLDEKEIAFIESHVKEMI